MNIFVQDGEERANATGLPGNESNAVLHTSFSSTGSSSDNINNGDDVSNQASAGQPASQAVGQTNLQPGPHPSQGRTRPGQMAYRTILPRVSSGTVSTINNRPGAVQPAHGGIGMPHHAAALAPRAIQSAHPIMPVTQHYGSVASVHQPGLHAHGSQRLLAPQYLPHQTSLQHRPIHPQSHTQPLPNQLYPNHSALQHPILSQQSLHQPAPDQANLGSSNQCGTIQQPRQASEDLRQPPQPRRQLHPAVHQQYLHQSGPDMGDLAHQPPRPQPSHTQPPVHLPSLERPTIPAQGLSQPPQQQATLQHTHRQTVQQISGLPSATKQSAIRQARIKQEPVSTQPEVNQQSTPLRTTLLQPIQVPQIMRSPSKRVRVEESTAGQPPLKKSSPKKQSIEQQQTTSTQSTSNKQDRKFIQMTGCNGSEKKKVITEKLVDYLPRESFDPPTPGIPDRLVHGGIIRPRPGLVTSSHDGDRIMDSGITKHPGEDGETPHESKTSHQDNLVHKLEANHQKNIAQPKKAPAPAHSAGSSTSQDFKGTREKTTEEKTALNAQVQRATEQDEEHIRKEISLARKDYEPQPTADTAIKARKGMTEEELASELKFDIKKLEENEQRLNAAEKERSSVSEKDIAATGLQLDDDALVNEIKSALRRNRRKVLILAKRPVERAPSSTDFFERISNNPEIIMEIAKYLKPKDLVQLYSISKPFHSIVSSFLAHTMQLTATTQAPESASVFRFKFYGELCTKDPGFRSHPRNADEVRMVPSPRWLQMVIHRDKTVRDILALLARQGHRMQEGASLSLKKMWLLMDVATTRQRVQLLHSPYFTDKDIFNMQMFFVKLDMRFNNPYSGPGTDKLRRVMLGQRGLTPLRNLLKRKIGRTEIEVVKIGIRYAHHVDPKHRGMPIFDIPPEEIGIGHLEGWGKGTVHLFRPDELVMREAVRRRLNLKAHIMGMMIWGYINPRTGKNIEVTDEEKYISESESEHDEYEAWNDEWQTDSEEDDSDTDEDNIAGLKV